MPDRAPDMEHSSLGIDMTFRRDQELTREPRMFALHCVRTHRTGVAAWILPWALLCLAALAACSNGRGSLGDEDQDSGFTVGGTISGLSGSGLVLQNNAVSNLALVANG